MKNLLPIILLFFTLTISAQTFNYQGALRTTSGQILANEIIDLRIGIYDGNSKLFEELHQDIQTNDQGIFSIQIGSTNDLNGIDYSLPLSIKTELKSDGSFKEISLDLLSSVPFAMQAMTVVDKDDADADPTNEIQTLALTDNKISISDGNEIELIPDDDGDPNNEIQQLSFNNGTLQIEDGGSVNLHSIISSRSGWFRNGNSILRASSGYNVGIGVNDPLVNLHLSSPTDAGLTGGGAFMIGSSGISNLIMDANEIIARVDGGPGALSLNKGSGLTYINEGGGEIRLGANGGGNTRIYQDAIISGQVGVDIANPLSQLHIVNGADASLSTHGYIMMGNVTGSNIIIDNNEIQARNNGAVSPLFLNWEGGALHMKLTNIGDHKNVQFNTATGQLGYDNSSRRYKENITALEDDWHKILKAKPVKYTRPGNEERWEFGYIAEDMDDIGLTNLVSYDADGIPDNFNYEKMITYVVEILKIQDQKIETLEKALDDKISQPAKMNLDEK